jgi:hypothetical protein
MRKKQGQKLHKQQSIENARQEQDSETSPRTGLQAIYYEHAVSNPHGEKQSLTHAALHLAT